MTYEEIAELADAVFDEYIPKTSPKVRRAFLDALVSELERQEAIDVEPPETDDFFEDDDNDF